MAMIIYIVIIIFEYFVEDLKLQCIYFILIKELCFYYDIDIVNNINNHIALFTIYQAIYTLFIVKILYIMIL